MSTELSQPFQLTPSGGVAVTTIPSVQVQQHLQSLVSTNPGERVMQPKYGVPLANFLFGLDTSQTAAAVSNDVSAAVAKWEPNVNIQDVRTMVSDTSEGLVSINVDYSPGAVAPSSSVISTASILVGGTVIEP
jgi:uncharacterized protein